MSSSTAAKTFRNDSRATSMPRSFWSFWNVFITSSFPFVAAEEGWQRARRFVDEYGEARPFLEPLSCAREEVWRSRASGGVGDEGGDRTKEGRGFPLSRVWRRDRDRTDSEAEPPLLAIPSALWHEGQVELWRSIKMAWAGTQCSIIKRLKEAATFSKATNQDSTPSIWEETKAWSAQISWTLFLTNSISGVNLTSSEGWGRLSSA